MEESCKLVEGHYQFDLPWKSGTRLPPSEFMARSRLAQLKKRLDKDANLKALYCVQMADNIKKGFIEPAPDAPGERIWYLPHHAVYNPNKPGKVRVVFDGAAKSGGISLNDMLLQGPDYLNSLAGILLRFRTGKIALSADIEGMFNQVKASPKDRDALRILWWPGGNLDVPAEHYRLTVQAFGLRSSPSVAAYAVLRTVQDNSSSFPKETLHAARQSFYVDDFLHSTNSEEQAKMMALQMTQLMKKGGFRLTKWLSSNQAVIDSVPAEERAPAVQQVDVCQAESQRALGMKWNVDGDYFFFSEGLKDGPVTKRGILSATASFFDPLGLLSPVVLKAKAILQEVCRKGFSWDDTLPEELGEEWKMWRSSLQKVEAIQIPRFCLPGGSSNLELHIFCDASTEAYGACAYLKTEEVEKAESFLISGKSRVRPLKQVTIPRLELQAAVTAVRMASQLRRELHLVIKDEFFWTDSQVVLSCINNRSKRFKTYFANRLTEIHEKSDRSQWHHVPTKENPADLASRGMMASNRTQVDYWLHGPGFLMKKREDWPSCDHQDVQLDKADVYNVEVEQPAHPLHHLLHRFSSFYKLKRAVAWLTRFKGYIQKKTRKGHLSTEELKDAEEAIIRLVQQECLAEDRNDLLHGGLKKKSQLLKLQPILHNGLIRVGGRLQFSSLPNDAKHPVILPKHHISNIIIQEVHRMNGHVGVEQVVAATREKYWILGVRSTVKSILKRCITCRKTNARPCTQLMAPLLQEQVEPDQPPFTNVGWTTSAHSTSR